MTEFRLRWDFKMQFEANEPVSGGRKRERLVLRRAGFLAAMVAVGAAVSGNAQNAAGSLQDRIARALIAHGDTPAQTEPSMAREKALELEGMSAAWYNTANGDDFRYVKRAVDAYLEASQNNQGVTGPDAAMGAPVLLMYRVTLQPKYYEAALVLRAEAAAHCGAKTAGSVVACPDAPFLAEYASVFQDPAAFKAITHALLEWDEAGKRPANASGQSPDSRDGLAREAEAIVDALPFYPEIDPGRRELIRILSRIVARSQGTVEPRSHADDCLLLYARMKGARLSYLPTAELAHAERDWDVLQRSLVKANAPENVDLDGSSSALLLAATEAEHAATATVARGKTALVDAWFNSQERKNAAGQMESFHYKWTDMADSGYALLGHMLRSYGMKTATLDAAPTAENLRSADYYFIASPDIPIKNPNPHYMTDADAAAIAAWVKQGGVLVMMENDPPNADIDHLNLLADRFGIHFDNVLHHHILGEHVEDGTIPVAPGGALFQHAHTLYMKDTCAISLHGSGQALLSDRGDIVMAAEKYGRGTVFATVDPWVYNEYTDGRKNPQIYGQFDNFAGGLEFVQWLAHQSRHASTVTGTRQRREP